MEGELGILLGFYIVVALLLAPVGRGDDVSDVVVFTNAVLAERTGATITRKEIP
jgi:hypothetical protein